MSEILENELQLALAICGHDGLISEAEVAVLISHFCNEKQMTSSAFERGVDLFFSNETPIELLLSAVDNKEDVLRVAEIAAAADGLDITENWALLKCRALMAAGLSDL